MQRPADLQACIDACNAAADAAERCAIACLAAPNPAEMSRCIQLDIDAAQLSRLVSSFLARDSENAKLLCEDCAEVLDRCAGECDGHAAHHEHCRMCAEACRLAMTACLRMAQAPIDESAMTAAGLPKSGDGQAARGH
jgi:hypothetical protein